MEALAGLTFVLVAVWVVGGIIFFIMILSIAIDSSKSAKRLNSVIELIRARNVILARICGGPGDSPVLSKPPTVAPVTTLKP
jgi:hypothetical protein